MLQYSLEAGLCWSFFYLIYICFLRKETFFGINRQYILISLCVGLMIPLLRMIDYNWQHHPDAYVVPLQFISSGPQYVATQVATTPEGGFDLTLLLIGLYLVGVVFMTLRLGKGLHKIRKIYRQGEKQTHEGFQLIMTESAHLPFSFLSKVFISKTLPLEDDLDQILQHELSHVKSRHTYDVLFVEILHVLFWWNPLIHLFKKELRIIHEYLADAVVLHETDKKIYGQILLGQSLSGLEIALTHQFFHSHLKNRIQMMYQKKSKRSALVKYLMAVPVLLMLMAAFAFTYEHDTLEEQLENAIYDVKDLNEANEKLFEIMQSNKHEHFNLCWNLENVFTVSYDHADGHEEVMFVDWKFSKNGYSKNALLSEFKNIYETANLNDVTVSKTEFHELLTNYWSQYPDQKEQIRNDFVGIANQFYGMRISFLKNDSFSSFQYVVPRDSLARYRSGEIPAYDQMIYGGGSETSFDLMRHLHEDLPSKPLLIVDGKEMSYERFWQLGFIGADMVGTLEPFPAREKYGDKGRKGAIEIKGIKLSSEHLSPKINDTVLVFNPISKQEEKKYITKKAQKEASENSTQPSGEFEIAERKVLDTISIFDDQTYSEEFRIITKTLQDTTYKKVDIMPRFPGCEEMKGDNEAKRNCSNEKLIKYIYTNLKYPVEARKKGIEGVTVIQFVVEKDGSLSSFKIARDIGGGCGAASQKAIESMNTKNIRWTPGIQDGQPVRVMYTMPVNYKLADNDKPDVGQRPTIQESNDIIIKDLSNDDGTQDELFKVVEEMPRFPGSEDVQMTTFQKKECADKKMIEFIYKNLQYPTMAREAHVEGVTVVQFVVEKDGTITNVKLARDIGQGCGQESMKAVKLMNQMNQKWTPGKQRGKAVRVLYTLPIRYKLSADTDDSMNNLKTIRNAAVEPLVLVDGVVVDSGILEELNPADIETVNVLKDESAEKKYGSKYDVSNGVIEIFLKENSKQKSEKNDQETSEAQQIFNSEQGLDLLQNKPNPFQKETVIGFTIPKSGKVTLSIYNVQGRIVHEIKGQYAQGYNEVLVKSSDFDHSGVLYYTLNAEGKTATKKMIRVEK